MKLILDTNRYRDLDQGVPEIVNAIAQATEVGIPFVVLAELHVGFRGGSKRAENERRLAKFLAQPGVRLLWPDETTVDIVANLSIQLNRQGTPIPAHDIWIAALAIQHQMRLCTRDKHFDHLSQITRV